ncbi:MAG: nucleotidyltransferase domain-containing protein [Deltaproteobacteria bacterium]|nr:nucleotidyltransferase domain-containing protein [Deltaproteobacteria bacterium]
MKYGLPDEAVKKIRTVLGRHPQVQQAILYGSRAKGTHKRGSDIDLTLRGGDDLTLPVLHRIMDELDDLLLPYTIDLSIYANIDDPEVKALIHRVGQVFYEQGEDLLEPA